jgi:hypothetical protein
MPRFALSFQAFDYEIAPASRLLMLRPVIEARLTQTGQQPHCFVDTGAALSVVSRSVAQTLPWTPRPVANDPIPRLRNGVLTPPPTPAAELLTWEGLPCELGELNVTLRNPRTGDLSSPLRLVAKFVQQPSRYFNNLFVILGMVFLLDNGVKLHVQGMPWGATGHLDVP